MDSLFVKIGQEMRKWQPKSSKKRKNRKSLGPPLKGGVDIFYDYRTFREWFSAVTSFFIQSSEVMYKINVLVRINSTWLQGKNLKKNVISPNYYFLYFRKSFYDFFLFLPLYSTDQPHLWHKFENSVSQLNCPRVSYFI